MLQLDRAEAKQGKGADHVGPCRIPLLDAVDQAEQLAIGQGGFGTAWW